MTEKQRLNREYYERNRDRILAQKETKRREQGVKPKRGRRMHCFICGGEVLTDGSIWSCMNPECEADFIEA